MTEQNSIDLVRFIDYWDFATYLSQTGWLRIETEAKPFAIFNGPLDINKKPVRIVLPAKEDTREQPLYFSNALDILSSLKNIEPATIAQDINTVNRDVLRVRIEGQGAHEAIPLRTAAQQINDLKQLVAYAARSEEDKKPYYINAQVPIAKDMVNAYRFGHTFRGSFGLTIETPRLQEIHTYQQLSLFQSLTLFPDSTKTTPIWRRVMERIARGLLFVDKATKERDPKQLLDNYATGLNANMCQALANMFNAQDTSVEFSIKWAPIQVPDDPLIRSFTRIKLDQSAQNQLAYAAKELVETHQEETTIRGTIVELNAKASPMDMDTSRSIRIQWFEPSEGKVYEATATLSVDDYMKAIGAHRDWHIVEITGLLTNKKDVWRFVDYSRFNTEPIVPDER